MGDEYLRAVLAGDWWLRDNTAEDVDDWGGSAAAAAAYQTWVQEVVQELNRRSAAGPFVQSSVTLTSAECPPIPPYAPCTPEPGMPAAGLLPNTFGVELEFADPNDLGTSGFYDEVECALRLAGYATPVSEDDGCDGTNWDVKTDGSCGLEITSPALTWGRVRELRTVTSAVWAAGGRTNKECGLHVHHAFPDLTNPQLRRVLLMWGALEEALMACVAPSRARNSYCRGLVSGIGNDSWERLKQEFTPVESLEQRVNRHGRYHTLNATHWWRTGRLEVRLHHGTLRYADITSWVLLTQQFIDAAKESVSVDTLDRLAQKPRHEKLTELVALVTGRSTHESVRALRDMIPHFVQRRNPNLAGAA
jgi:hypothetical protein